MAICSLIKVWASCLRKRLFLICCPDIHHGFKPIFIDLSGRQIIKERNAGDLPGGRQAIRRRALRRADSFFFEKPQVIEYPPDNVLFLYIGDLC